MLKNFNFIFINSVHNSDINNAEFNLFYNILIEYNDDELNIKITEKIYYNNILNKINNYQKNITLSKKHEIILKNIIGNKILQVVFFYDLLEVFNGWRYLTFDSINYNFL
jgi:hypothetical protein